VDEMAPILGHLDKARAALLATAGSVPPDRWRQAPRAGAWSAGEVIAHLIMVERRIVESAEKIVNGPPTVEPLWKQIHLPLRVGEWRGFRVRSPIPLDASLVADKETALEKLHSLRQETLRFVEKNRSRDLHNYRFRHPFFGSLNLYDWLRSIAYHETRHAKQLQEIVLLAAEAVKRLSKK
jgi:hypothetical protein